MYLRAKVYTKTPEWILRRAMLEDREAHGYIIYRKGYSLIHIECQRPSTCFATLEDRMRCLALVEDLYAIINTKIEGKEESK